MNTSVFASNSHYTDDDTGPTTVKTIALPDKCFKNRVGCTWRRVNEFCVYPRSQTTSQSGNEIRDDKILNIRQRVMLFSPILRKLVNESNGTFLSLQKTAEAAKNSDNQVEFLKLSRQYRSIIRVCIESLQEAASKETDGVQKNELLSQITIFYSIECIWHLSEILFIDNIPGDVVLPYLLEWVRFHFPCHEQTAAQLLEACERGSESHTEYWNTVIGMIVQGRVDVARALLKLHTACDTNEFRLVDNSLRSMPVYSVYSGISSGEFTISWKHWQAECRSKLNSRALASQPNLELILKLITGEYGAWESIRDRYDSWFDLWGGWLMFTCPVSRRHELTTAVCACAGMRSRRGVTPAPPLDRVVRALAEGDLHMVLHEIQQMSDNGWFATHLTDILYHCGVLNILDKHQHNVTSALRESLILEYGTLLFEHTSLWAVGLSYLAGAGAGAGSGATSGAGTGMARAAELMSRLPLRSDARALRIIAEAKKYGLPGVSETVCVSMGGRPGRVPPGGALWWSVRGRAGRTAARTADGVLRGYTQGRPLPAQDLLLTIGSGMLLTDRLVFLAKYSEFHRLYKNREFKAAGKLLVSLLTSKITPDYFWETLLLDTLPLLESDEPILSSEATCETMAILAIRATTLSEEKTELLRLALARNLAKALLAPMDD